MNTTRSSLLDRVRDLDNASSWVEFDKLYRPLLMHYARGRGLGATDAEEIAQQCLEVIVRQISGFRKRSSFRSWLRAIVANKVKKHFRERKKWSTAGADALADAVGTEEAPDAAWDRQWELAHLAYCMEDLRSYFAEHTVRAFQLYVIHEVPVAVIASLLGMTPNQIYVAKSRVTRRIKERFSELLRGLYGEGS